MYGVFLIAVLVITGGVIAFIGDRLGTKIGKKRLSIFGLRPRHTSIIVTIITGAFITTMTFAVMAAASENVRTALFGMEKLKTQMADMKQAIVTASGELEAAKEEKLAADSALEKAKEDVAKLSEQQKELEAESERLQAGNELLQQEKEALQGDNDRLGSENNFLSAHNEKLVADNEALAGSNEKLAKDNKDLEANAQRLRDGLIAVREGDITFRAGEILASGVIQGGRSEKAVEDDLQSLAQLANRNVSARMGVNLTEQGLWIYQPEAEAAIKNIAASPQDMVVRIVAAGNLLRGEVVRASLELYKNSIIYGSKELIIAKPYVLVRHDEEEAEMIAMDFLSNVNQAAGTKGILPDPLSGAVGVIEGMQFYNLVENMQRSTDHIVLSAYARDATDAQGPLRLDFKLEPGLDKDSIYPAQGMR